MSNEIKQGDKVRVSGHYLAIMIADGIVHNALNNATFVVDNIDRKGRMAYVSCKLPISLQSPIVHLIKVDAEAKEAKYHKGDRVKFKNIYELQKVKDKSFRWMLVLFASKEATITEVEDNGFYRVDIDPSIGGINDDMIECKVEPTEQTEAEKPNHTIKIPVEVDLTDSYWDAYTADLAKEIVLKTVNSASDRRPSVIAEYATDVAKAVVEGLKRK